MSMFGPLSPVSRQHDLPLSFAQQRLWFLDKLITKCRRERVTLFMALAAAFNILLYRYTGQEDIAIAFPIANRNQLATESLIGFFVNTLILRTNLSGESTCRDLLARVRGVCLDAYEYQDLPFEKLVEELKPERDLGRNPFTQIMFAFQNTPETPLNITRLMAAPMGVGNLSAQFDLGLSLEESADGLTGSLVYSTELFNDDTVSRMIRHYRTLLEGMVTIPDRKISELPMLTPRERRQILVDWNDTYTDYPDNVCFYKLFEAQVERTPHTPAVIFEDQQLTYNELNTKANQLAHYLHSLGVGPEVLVGICMRRSLDMEIGLLGVLKSGGAFLPLDPTHPKDRLAFMLSDSEVKVLLTQGDLLINLPQHGAHVVCLDRDWDVISQQGMDNPVGKAMSENLAESIYSSKCG